MIYIVRQDKTLLSFPSLKELNEAGYNNFDFAIEDGKYSGVYTIEDDYIYIYPILSEYKTLAKNMVNLYLAKNSSKYSSFEEETFATQYSGAMDILSGAESEDASFVETLYESIKDGRTLEEFVNTIVDKHNEQLSSNKERVIKRHQLHQSIDAANTHKEVIGLLKGLSINPQL